MDVIVICLLGIGIYLITKKKVYSYGYFLVNLLFLLLFHKNINLDFSRLNIIINIFSFLMSYFLYLKKEKKSINIFLVLGIITLFLELSLFNINYFITYFNKEEIYMDYEVGSNEVVLSNINKKVNSLYIEYDDEVDTNVLSIYGTDEGNSDLYLLGTTEITKVEKRLNYIKIHPYGNLKTLKISGNTNYFEITKIVLNPVIPISISIFRIIFVYLVLLLLYCIRPSSSLYKIKLKDKNNFTSIVTFMMGCICSLFLVIQVAPCYQKDITISFKEYQYLARSLSVGRFDIDLEVPEIIQELENPYDEYHRDIALLNHGEDIYNTLWDYSYFKGKVYCYFGITPVLLTYLPFYLLFHVDLLNIVPALLFSILCIVGIFYFLKVICKKYYPEASLLTYLLLCFLFIFCAGVIDLVKIPNIYDIPILGALGFTYLGLGLWIDSVEENKLNIKKMIFGSICIAASIGCRPQFIVSICFAPIVFKKYISLKKENFKKYLYFFLPFIIYGLFIMLYNYLRFGSIFDFGSNYNLTTNDMTHRGFNIDRLFTGIYYYLFYIPRYSNVFPFLESGSVSTTYIGMTIQEYIKGGILFGYPVLWYGFGIFNKKSTIDKSIKKIGMVSLLLGFIVLLLDTELSGLLPRYCNDFLWLFFIPTSIIILEKEKKKEDRKVFIILFLVSMFFAFCSLFIFEEPLSSINTSLFYKLKSIFEFWR